MSLEKVNAYREKKVNRKAELEAARKKKIRDKIIGWAVVGVITVGLAVALVITGVNMYTSYKESLPSYDAESIVINEYVEHTEETEAESEEAVSEEATTAAQ